MSNVYISSEGDTVDYIAWKFYGTQAAGVVESVLAANFGLASHGPILPAGLEITMPAIATAETTTSTLSLWD
jgi:phage tail protein X